jgi:hypothetical protein
MKCTCIVCGAISITPDGFNCNSKTVCEPCLEKDTEEIKAIKKRNKREYKRLMFCGALDD